MIRFGIIGTNWITEAWLEGARELPHVQLTAVYSRTEERAREFADKHGASHIFTDLKQMAASDVLDAVYIASPNSLHQEYAVLMMEHGKHVLCEKPLASNAREVQDMIEVARKRGVVLMEAMKSTLMPDFRAIADHLPRLGPVRRYFASFCQYSSRYDAYKRGEVLNAFRPEFANGSLMDLGVYCLYPLIVLFGKPNRVQAAGELLSSGVDGQGSLILQYEGMEAVLMHSKITHSSLPAEIMGEEGSIIIPKISQPRGVKLHLREGHEEALVPTQEEHHSMMYETQEFVGLIERGEQESAINSHQHSLWTMEVMDEARKQIGLVYPGDRS